MQFAIKNHFFQSLVNYVAAKTPHYLQYLNEALGFLFPGNSIFLTAKVRDILFDGMIINCTSKDFTAMAVCAQIRTKIPGIKYESKDYLKYALLGDVNLLFTLIINKQKISEKWNNSDKNNCVTRNKRIAKFR